VSAGPRIAVSTLAFPDASLATALSLGRGWGYGGVELRLIDGELIDPSMPAAARAQVRRAEAGLPIVLLGGGEVQVQEMPGLLTGAGYQGWISVEWEKRWHPEIEEPEVALPQHLRLLELWLRDPQEAV
jgi:sugar phosphate isomerase/epimerase